MVYVHVPFCRSFCTYCDFFSTIACSGADSALFEAYVRGIEKEAASRRDEILSTKGTDTIYIGGGTPSVLPLSMLGRITDAIENALGGSSPAAHREFTVEVNPDDIVEKGPEYVRGLLALGVNRVSMGVQSLSDDILHWMNRRHSADGAREAFGILRRCGVENISVDIIFGLSNLDDGTLEKTVKEVLEWHPEHISAYQLSIEEGSALSEMVRDARYIEASDEKCRAQYDFICKVLREGGYNHYEISNWALPGKEAVHNSAYWSRRPYVGLGPGAHSLSIGGARTKERRSWNSEDLSAWTSEGETLTSEEIREERLMLGLRTKNGVDGKSIPEKDWFVSDDIILDMI